jgi:ABC-2 type transport system ATP-binding protein
MVCVKNLTKRFGDRVVVDNISFTVQKGEMLGLLGPNGAGKTTTLRIIAGYIPSSEGSVFIDGMDIFEHPYEVKKKIGYMPEHPPLYYDMTAWECLSFVAEIHGMRGNEIKRSIEKVSELCGITHVLRRLTGNLSKGFRQRVGLAQALIHSPEILVLDEPTIGLDPKQIIEIRELIKQLGRERTVILSSHILFEVTNICKKVAIMDNGRLIAVDTIESLSERLSGGRQIVIKVLRPERVDIKRLSSIQGVINIAGMYGNEFILNISEGESVLDRISSSIVDMGAGLIEMRQKGMTLEDIFIKVVSGEEKY